jgi:hypothetical protein
MKTVGLKEQENNKKKMNGNIVLSKSKTIE